MFHQKTGLGFHNSKLKVSIEAQKDDMPSTFCMYRSKIKNIFAKKKSEEDIYYPKNKERWDRDFEGTPC